MTLPQELVDTLRGFNANSRHSVFLKPRGVIAEAGALNTEVAITVAAGASMMNLTVLLPSCHMAVGLTVVFVRSYKTVMLAELQSSGWMPRFYYSHYHIMAAAFFARQSAQLERKHEEEERLSAEIFPQHRAYVTGSVFSAVSFLEGQINELFTDAADDKRDFIHKLGDRVVLLGAMWNLDVPRTASYSILEKYEIALALAEREPLDRGALVYQDARLLIRLRNMLIHYEPMSSTSTAKTSRDEEERFRGKFSPNPLTGSKTPFFPERCLGHGCAKWAVESSVRFVDHCCSRLEVEPVFNSNRDSLSTE
jgi:hypothetical protein